MSYLDHDRSWYPANGNHPAGDPVVRSSSGSQRPPLATPLDTFTVHYIGAGQTWLDVGDTARELASIETGWAIPQGKPNEYNSASDSECETWQWAGAYRAAHCSGANDWAWGHLVVYGLEDPTPSADKLIAGVRRARRQLVAAGCLTPDHQVKAHQEMPGASTGCPGPLFTNKTWWNQITAPLDAPTNPPPEGGHMNTPIIRIEGFADQFLCIPLSAETKARLAPTAEESAPIVLAAKSRAAFAHRAGYKLSPMPGE